MTARIKQPGEVPWLTALKKAVEARPALVLRFPEWKWARLAESRRGIGQFSDTYPHEAVEQAKTPTICIVSAATEDGERLYVGLVTARTPISTFRSRITVKHLAAIQPQTERLLIRLLNDPRHARNLANRLKGSNSAICLSPKLSLHLIERLADFANNRDVLRRVEDQLASPRHYRGPKELQEDAVQTALAAFDLQGDIRAHNLQTTGDHDTALFRVPLMEDTVIQHDARIVPGYALVESHVTGRAIFERRGERLEVITANRLPLEHVFGVDLIYYNETKQNVVMLQYKMLEPDREDEDTTDWIYRPDSTFKREVIRMRRFARECAPGPFEYRLNSEVFYLKFVKRDGAIRHGGIIIPIDHLAILENDADSRGARGGFRISFDSLSGRYLRSNAFVDLVRSGYIGARPATTRQLKSLIDAIIEGNRSVVTAIQRRVETGSFVEDD